MVSPHGRHHCSGIHSVSDVLVNIAVFVWAEYPFCCASENCSILLQLMLALSNLVKNVLFQGSLERSDIAAFFPGMFSRTFNLFMPSMAISDQRHSVFRMYAYLAWSHTDQRFAVEECLVYILAFCCFRCFHVYFINVWMKQHQYPDYFRIFLSHFQNRTKNNNLNNNNNMYWFLFVIRCSAWLCDVSGEFNKNLAGLLVKIFVQRLPQWKHHAADNLGNEWYISLITLMRGSLNTLSFLFGYFYVRCILKLKSKYSWINLVQLQVLANVFSTCNCHIHHCLDARMFCWFSFLAATRWLWLAGRHQDVVW